MKKLRTRFSLYLSMKGRSLTTKIVFSVSALLLLSSISEFILLRYYDRNWDRIAEQEAAGYLNQAIQAFSGVQRETRRVGTDVAQHPAVLASLTDPSRDRSEIFEFVSRITREQQVGIEVYDMQAHMICWDGPSEPSHSREIAAALAGKLSSFVTRAQVFSQLFVATPVWSQGKVLGAVLVRHTTELNYPLNNKLSVSTGLAEKLSRELGVQVEYDFSLNASLRKDGRYASAVLIGIDSSEVGVVSVAHPSRGAFLESVSSSFHTFNSALWLLLVGVVCSILGGRVTTIHSILMRGIAATLLIWGVRYLFVWFDLPSSVIHGSVFDPTFFASTFGNGLAKSIGELFLTTIALFANTVIIGRYILGKDRRVSPWWSPSNPVLRWVLVSVVAIVVFLLLRGYAAAIRSAVFDSTLRYNDPRVIVPSFELGIMVLSLFLLSFCLITAVVGLTSFAFALFAGRGRAMKTTPWLVVAGVYALAAVLSGSELASPLVPLPYRMLFAAGVMAFTYSLHRQGIQAKSIVTLRTLLLAFALSVMLFYPVLDANVRDRDRDRVEAYAQQIIKPSDTWLKFILDEALMSFSSEETVNTLLNGDGDAVDLLAFDHWARSTAAREGYSCIFAVTDSSGNELSRFMIGGQASLEMYHNLLQKQSQTKWIIVERNGIGVNAIRVYSGSIPITTSDGALVAHGYVVLAASQQTLFRGKSPTVLRSEPQESIEDFYRPMNVSEFHDNRLLTSDGTLLPIGYRLPPSVQEQLSDSTITSFWSEQRIDDKVYDTFYIKRPMFSNQVVALSVPQLGMRWHLMSIVKVFVYYAIVVLVFGIGLFVVQWLRGHRYQFTFRDKLLVALLATALIPLIIMATYARQLARERLLDSTSSRLEQETATLNASIEQRLQGEEGIVQEALSRDEIDRLANEAGADFNLYVGNQLQASSRPELYDAGVLDKRLSGLAFANTVLKGKRFYLQTETIGSYQYAVGYRPLVSGAGWIAGIVAVPTLYRIEEVEEEVSRRNTLIFGMYAIVVFGILVIATTFANRIAAPIHQLTLATKRVARGDLNVTVGVQRADGEIGGLIRSFEAMTKELARSREDLVRFERELAWKEMAKQVAHEIKNPLTPMKLSMQHLRQTYKDRVANFEHVFDEVSKTIIEQIDTLSRIASEFASFARMPKPILETVDVNAVLRESVLLFEQDATIRFELVLEDNLPPVKSDREELRRAFINIIRNGVQAMSNSGQMTVRSRSEHGKAIVTLRDEGVGMSEEVKARLFQPNFSTKTDGMGLGLAITKKIIDDLGGSIIIDSTEGKGTTVTIIIPAEQ
jgi:two-component system, NtrC family, nitrogen regulation sensor histidine kinase NtrY